jgi:hypothetical protein
MNRIAGKQAKKIEDIETILHVFQKFALAKVPFPVHLQGILNEILGSDVELSAFYHLRSLRYPSIRRAIRSNTNKALGLSDRDDCDPEDDDFDLMPRNWKRKTSIEIERMYR